MFGAELMQAFREFKAAWDPQNRMNPHKLIDAYEPTENQTVLLCHEIAGLGCIRRD